MKPLVLLILTACVLAVSATAGMAVRTVDMRTVLAPSHDRVTSESMQTIALRMMDMSVPAAHGIFSDRPATLELQNFPVSAFEDGTLFLTRTRAPYDANSRFRVGTKNGPRTVILAPVASYRGTVNGDPRTNVSLHVSQDGEMTGWIDMADGHRTVIGRDYNSRVTTNTMPHVIGWVEDVMPGLNINNFICGQESLPMDEDAVRRAYASAEKRGAVAQADSMREIRMALEIREDVTETMYARGQSDEQIIAYFVKIYACMNQAYEEELNASFVIVDLFLYNNDFTSPYPGPTSQLANVLGLFAEQWAVRTDIERDAAHLYCLFPPGGGVAGIAKLGPAICDDIYQEQGPYGVSTVFVRNNTELPGRPNVANGFVWDVMVGSHEVGHNVGALHTHNCYWAPPVDTCQLKEDNTDACYSRTEVNRVVRDGTIMSYCHLVNNDRIPLTFGPRVAPRMKGWIANSCAKIITRPWVRITEPRGAETFSAGTTLGIKFASARVTQIDLEYSTDGTSWTSIAKNVNAATRGYDWKVPTIATNSLWIRAFSSDDPTAADTTLASYTVSTPLTLVSPKGGERFAQGQDISVTFAKGPGVGDVKIEFTANGTDWTTLATVGGTTTSYVFPAPAVVTENARVRISSGSFAPTSNPFAIGIPNVALTWPAPGGTLCNNVDNQYKWLGDFVDRIRIRYTKDGGTTWDNAIQQISIDQYLHTIFSLSSKLRDEPKGTVVTIGVFNNSDLTTPLSIASNITLDSCSGVTGVDDDLFASATSLSIVRITPNPASTTATITYAVATAAPVTIEVVSVTGERVLSVQGTATTAGGQHQTELSLEALAAGRYTVVVSGAGLQATAPLTVTR